MLAAQSAIISEMARGEITPQEAQIVTGVVELKRRAIETVEHENRIAALEAARDAKTR